MIKVIWTGPKAVMEIASVYFTEIADAAHATALEKSDPTTDAPSDEWRFEAYFDDQPDFRFLDSTMTAIDERWSARSDPTVETVPDIDWVAHALEGLGVIEIGRFTLYGVHDADKASTGDGRIPIRIDANQAFGTGHHPTTSGCLELLDRLGGLAPPKILDLGCGSAVLAIAAAKMWRRMVLATDIDATSIEIAAENARLNDVEDFVITEVADGFDHALIAEAAPFDFVFANILAGPLKEFAPDMAAHVKPNGRVMLAGLMAEQEAGVINAYEQAGFRLINRLDHQTWPVLLFVRSALAASETS